jgi:predicted transcriptional regulator
LVLTVKGKAEAIVLEPAAYQRFAEYQDTVAGIRRGLAQAKKGLGRSVDDVFDAIERG